MSHKKMNDFTFLLQLARLKPQEYYALISDSDPGQKLENEIKKRDEDYTRLLDNYVCITNVRNIAKEIHKWVFFWLIIVAGFFVMRYSYKILNKVLSVKDVEYLIDCIPLVISGIVSFVSTIIAIPLTITKFLFNTQEDDNITNVIKHTQDHDSSALTLFKERFSKKDSSSEPSNSEQSPIPSAESIDSDTA